MTAHRQRRPALRPVILAVVITLAVAGPAVVAPVPAAAAGPEAAATANGPARIAFNGSRKQHVVALTFDDGSSAANTRRVFDILRAEHVPATFFPYAYKVRADPALWRAISAAGYPIGHHSLSHADLTTVTEPRLRYEIRHAQRIIEEITGRPMLRVLRPPYGARDERLRAVAGELGFPTLLLWDVETRDTARNVSVSRVYERATHGRNGSVVLLHAGPRITPAVLRAIIANYRSRGFTFVTIPELLGPKRAPWPDGSEVAATSVAGGSTATEPVDPARVRAAVDASPEPDAPRSVPARLTARGWPVRS